MKVLQICSARELGGGERHLADLANALAERGHDVYAAVVPASPLVNELNSIPKRNITEMRMRNALDVSAALKLARTARKLGIDVIHAHMARDYPLAALASRWSDNTPFILTRHVLFPLSKVHRIALARASCVIAVSEAVARSVRRQNIFSPDKVVTIHNGIDTRRFACDIRPSKDRSFFAGSSRRLIVGMIGHIAPIKGQEDLILAAEIVLSERDDVGFVIVGEDKSRDGANRSRIDALIARLGLEESVHLTGWQDDVAECLCSFDIFVSPSRSEAFGLVILEAMAAGLPIIATMSEGAIEILEDGVTGKLVPVSDPMALADAISKLLDAPGERKRIAASAISVVEQRFSLSKMVDETEMVYLQATAHDGK